jgi:hypothetical protein
MKYTAQLITSLVGLMALVVVVGFLSGVAWGIFERVFRFGVGVVS